MATRKIYMGRTNNTPADSTEYYNILSPWLSSSSIPSQWYVAGKFRNLKVTLSSGPGVGKTRVFTLYVNGSPTALAVTLTGSGTGAGINTGTDEVNEVTVADGDTVQLVYSTTGSPGFTDWVKFSIEQDSSSTGQSMNGGSGTSNLTDNCTLGSWAYTNPSTANPSSDLARICSRAGVPGTIDKYGLSLTTAPGGATARNFVLYKNGTAQDGTGGTPDTRFSISGSATTGSASGFSLSVAAGDRIWILHTVTGSPAASGASGSSIRFTANTDGMSMMGNDNPTFAAVNGNPADLRFINTPGNQGWGATESSYASEGPVTTVRMQDLYVEMGAAGQWSIYFRKNSGDTSLAAATSGSNATYFEDTSHQVNLSSNDTWDWTNKNIVYNGDKQFTWTVGMYVNPSILVRGGQGNNKGGKGPKGLGGKQVFGPSGMLFWDTINGFGQ